MIFGELWAYRELLYFFVWRDIKVRYKQTVIGAAWAILQPVLTMIVFSLFFGKLAKIPSQGLPYPIFYYSALLPWMYFATAMQGATNIVVDNQRVITKIYFPRVVLPIASVLSGLLDFAISFAVFLVMMAYYRIIPTAAVIWLPAFLLLAVLDGARRWLVAFRTECVVSETYATLCRSCAVLDVCFARCLSQFSGPGTWRWLYGLNPMAGVIEGFRWALTGHGQPPGILLAASSGGRDSAGFQRIGLLSRRRRHDGGRGLITD